MSQETVSEDLKIVRKALPTNIYGTHQAWLDALDRIESQLRSLTEENENQRARANKAESMLEQLYPADLRAQLSTQAEELAKLQDKALVHTVKELTRRLRDRDADVERLEKQMRMFSKANAERYDDIERLREALNELRRRSNVAGFKAFLSIIDEALQPPTQQGERKP